MDLVENPVSNFVLLHSFDEHIIGSVDFWSFDSSANEKAFLLIIWLVQIEYLLSKMYPLKTTKQVLTWLCVYPASTKTPVKIIWCILFSVIFCIVNLNGVAASGAYFLKYAASDLESALYALFQVDSLTATAYMNVVLLVSHREIIEIFDGLNQIFDASNQSFVLFFIHCNQFLVLHIRVAINQRSTILDTDEDAYRLLAQTNHKCEWLWKFYFKYVMGGYCGNLLLASVCSVLFCLIFIGSIDRDFLFMPYRLMWVKLSLCPIGVRHFNENTLILFSPPSPSPPPKKFTMGSRNANRILGWNIFWHNQRPTILSSKRCHSVAVYFNVLFSSRIFANISMFIAQIGSTQWSRQSQKAHLQSNSISQHNQRVSQIRFIRNSKVRIFHFTLSLEDGSWRQLKFIVALLSYNWLPTSFTCRVRFLNWIWWELEK